MSTAISGTGGAALNALRFALAETGLKVIPWDHTVDRGPVDLTVRHGGTRLSDRITVRFKEDEQYGGTRQWFYHAWGEPISPVADVATAVGDIERRLSEYRGAGPVAGCCYA